MKVTYYVGASLDGYIAKEDGDVSWLEELDVALEDTGYEGFYATVDGLVMGRNTFEAIRGFGAWPYGDKRTWVCTHGDVEPIEGANLQEATSPADVVQAARDTGIAHLWLVGGGILAASFVDEALLTDINVSLMPIVLGSGIPLFGPLTDSRLVKLSSCRTSTSGFLQIAYDIGDAQ